MTVAYHSDEIDCGADALRRFEQGDKSLRLWGDLPNGTKAKWREKVRVVLDAMNRERNRTEAKEAIMLEAAERGGI